MSGLPAAFLRRMEIALGDEYAAFLRAMEGPGAPALRLNLLRPNAREAAADLIDEPVPWCPDGFYVRAGLRPGADLRHTGGLYYAQEASAMAPAMVLRPQPGELALDLCAAPGGKAGQLAAMLAGGALVANEIELARARALSGNLERLGVCNAVVVSEPPDRLAARWPGLFDAVLVDAPCSGEGMFRRDAGAVSAWQPKSPEGCAVRQAAILDQAARLVRPGGRLCYSTCTFSELENECAIRQFLTRHADFEPMAFSLPGVGDSEGGMLRLWPHRLRGDGHFVALLKRRGDAEGARSAVVKPSREAETGREMLLRDVLAGWPDWLVGWPIELNGDCLYALPPRLSPFQGLRLLRRGLHLARVGRGYVRPDHALAMALRLGEARRAIELSARQAARALAGEELEGDGEGWTLLCHQGLPLGWAKAGGGRLKNHIPKGLRMPNVG